MSGSMWTFMGRVLDGHAVGDFKFGVALLELVRPGKPTENRNHHTGGDERQEESGNLHSESPVPRHKRIHLRPALRMKLVAFGIILKIILIVIRNYTMRLSLQT